MPEDFLSGIFSGVGGLISGAGDAIGSAINAQSQADINAANLGFQRENLAYQKDIQRQMFEREDNAVQRRRRDLEAAGLSPVLAAGQAAQAGPVVSTQALDAGRNPGFGDVAKAIGSTPGAVFDVMGAALRNQQLGANIAQTQAQTDLIRQQTANAATEGEFGKRSLGDRVESVRQAAMVATNNNISGALANVLRRLDTSAVLGAAADERFKAGHGPYEFTKEQRELGLDPTMANPRFWPELERARADARSAGIGAEFDQMMLEYERDYGLLLRGAGDAGKIVGGVLNMFRDRAPRSTVLHVRGR